MAKKERYLIGNFKYDGNSTDYSFQTKKKLNLWWLLLLLLPLLLLIPLRKDVTVYTQLDGKAEPYVDVKMDYTARYLLWDKKFMAKVPYDTIQQTDSTGCTVFKRVGYSVYSYIFHSKTPVVFSAGGDDCYDTVSKTCRFHTTRKVVLDMSPRLTDVKLKVIDMEYRFVIPGARVECDYEGRSLMQHVVDTTDATGCVVVKDARVCGEFNAIKASAEGYSDTLLTHLQVTEMLKQTDGYVIPLRLLWEPPVENCGVHFSGGILGDGTKQSYVIFGDDPCGEYVGSGYYPNNEKAFPKAVKHTFDAIAVDKGTRLIIYSKPQFEGDVLLDVVGPMLITNVKWKNNSRYNDVATKTFPAELQELFPPSRRQWSSGDMWDWSSGSCKIICGE